MKKHLMITTAAGAALALTAPANADGTYVKLFGGINTMDDQSMEIGTYTSSTGYSFNGPVVQTITISSFPITFVTFPAGSSYHSIGSSSFPVYANVTFEFSYHRDHQANYHAEIGLDNGFVIGAAFGQEYAGGFSIEGELAWRKNDADVRISSTTQNTLLLETRIYYNKFIFTSEATIELLHYQIGTYGGPTYWSGGSSSLLVDSGDLTSFSVMANAWYEINTGSGINPYFGGGLGYAKVELDVGGLSVDDSAIAYQAAIGLRWAVSEKVSLNMEVRHFEVPSLDLSTASMDLSEFEYKSDEILVGVRFMF